MAWSGSRTPGMDAFERMRRGAEAEIAEMTAELLEDATRDAPTEPITEHVERYGEAPPLKESGRVVVEVTPDGIEGRVQFDRPYAVYVEERRELKHDDGKAGFLGDNVKALAARYRERLAAASRRAIDG